MDDLVSRQAAIDAIYETFCYAYCDNCEKEMNEDLCGDCHRKYQNWAASKKIISKTINSLPSAKRHGRWVSQEYMSEIDSFIYTEYKCSNCGEISKKKSNYCPNCGAKMDEVSDCSTCSTAQNTNLEDDDSPCRDCEVEG